YTINEKVPLTASNRRKRELAREGDLVTYKKKRKTIDPSTVVPPNNVYSANEGVSEALPPTDSAEGVNISQGSEFETESAQAGLGAQPPLPNVSPDFDENIPIVGGYSEGEGATSNDDVGPSDKSLLRSFRFYRARSIALGQEKLPIRVHHHQSTSDLRKEPQVVLDLGFLTILEAFENNLLQDLNTFKSLKAEGPGNSLSLKKLKEHPGEVFNEVEVFDEMAVVSSVLEKGGNPKFEFIGVITEVPKIILRCISRDEAVLAVAQKSLYENALDSTYIRVHLAILSTIRDVCKLVVKELTSRRKLEETELQQALELQSRRLMGLQLLDIKKLHHHQRNMFSGSAPICSPYSPHMNDNLIVPPSSPSDRSNPDSPFTQEICGSPPSIIVEKNVMNDEKEEFPNSNNHDDSYFHNSSNSNNIINSLEHNLPDSPFASPTKSGGDNHPFFTTITLETDKMSLSSSSSSTSTTNNNLIPSSLLPTTATSTLDISSYKLCFFPITRREDDANQPLKLACIAYTVIYMLYVLGSFLFPTKKGTDVSARYLVLFTKDKVAKKWSWGSVVLTQMYYNLGAASRDDGRQFACCTTLLEKWDVFVTDRYGGTALLNFMEALDNYKLEDVVGDPYIDKRDSPHAFKEVTFFYGALASPDHVQPYYPNRVVRQFNREQGIPTKRLLTKWKEFVLKKADRGRRVREGPLVCTEAYLEWFASVSWTTICPITIDLAVDDSGIHQRKPVSVNEHGDTPVHKSEDIAKQYDASILECKNLEDKNTTLEAELRQKSGLEDCNQSLSIELNKKYKEIESLKVVNRILMEQIDMQLPPAIPLAVLQSHQPVPDTTLAKKYENLLAAHEDVKKKLIAKEDFVNHSK
ncbi:hypothetical protein GIB67_010987, partial [Kingdonia uniflora]